MGVLYKDKVKFWIFTYRQLTNVPLRGGPLEDLVLSLSLTLRVRFFFIENVGTVPLNKLLNRQSVPNQMLNNRTFSLNSLPAL